MFKLPTFYEENRINSYSNYTDVSMCFSMGKCVYIAQSLCSSCTYNWITCLVGKQNNNEIKFTYGTFRILYQTSYGYTREEAINILDGKNPDGSSFIPLPF